MCRSASVPRGFAQFSDPDTACTCDNVAGGARQHAVASLPPTARDADADGADAPTCSHDGNIWTTSLDCSRPAVTADIIFRYEWCLLYNTPPVAAVWQIIYNYIGTFTLLRLATDLSIGFVISVILHVLWLTFVCSPVETVDQLSDKCARPWRFSLQLTFAWDTCGVVCWFSHVKLELQFGQQARTMRRNTKKLNHILSLFLLKKCVILLID